MKRKDKDLLDAAYRERQGMIAILGSCLCAFPMIEYPESTGHAIECPAHYMLMAARVRAAGVVLELDEGLKKLAAEQDNYRRARNGGGS